MKLSPLTSNIKKAAASLQKGFSLIELIVVIGIFSLILSIALFNQNKLNNNILLTNLAYEIALLVRETQSYGIGVRAADAAQGFEGGYGISFDPRTPGQVTLFNDKDNNQRVSGPSEVSSVYTIQNQRGNSIVAQCIGAIPGECVGNSTLINIIFKRPNPEAVFLRGNISGSAVLINEGIDTNLSGPAYIVIKTPTGDNCRVVVVEQTGQIRVEGKEGGKCI
ncbi:MAG: hypothetical protein RL094_770 [Candidatus Parcubacteria bacterium]|jgi:prepilin-type N-terminal cleavage/methylation domain-containing protein